MALTTFQSGITEDKFLSYLKDVLIPSLCPRDTVMMGNCRIYHLG